MTAATADRVAADLAETAQVLSRVFRKTIREAGDTSITPAQFHALCLLEEHRDASLSEIAEEYGTSPPATSSLVDGLVRRDLVARDHDPADRRRLALRLTDEGGDVLRSKRTSVEAVLRSVLADVSARDLATVQEALAILRASLQRSAPMEVGA